MIAWQGARAGREGGVGRNAPAPAAKPRAARGQLQALVGDDGATCRCSDNAPDTVLFPMPIDPVRPRIYGRSSGARWPLPCSPVAIAAVEVAVFLVKVRPAACLSLCRGARCWGANRNLWQ